MGGAGARSCFDPTTVSKPEYAVLACVAGLAGRRPKAAAGALAELVRRRGLERASEVLIRWASSRVAELSWNWIHE